MAPTYLTRSNPLMRTSESSTGSFRGEMIRPNFQASSVTRVIARQINQTDRGEREGSGRRSAARSEAVSSASAAGRQKTGDRTTTSPPASRVSRSRRIPEEKYHWAWCHRCASPCGSKSIAPGPLTIQRFFENLKIRASVTPAAKNRIPKLQIVGESSCSSPYNTQMKHPIVRITNVNADTSRAALSFQIL